MLKSIAAVVHPSGRPSMALQSQSDTAKLYTVEFWLNSIIDVTKNEKSGVAA